MKQSRQLGVGGQVDFLFLKILQETQVVQKPGRDLVMWFTISVLGTSPVPMGWMSALGTQGSLELQDQTGAV